MTARPRFADVTTIGVGGQIADFIQPETRDDLIAAVMTADDAGRPLCVLGGGSNLLASDEDFDGVVVRDARHTIAVQPLTAEQKQEDGRLVRIAADAGVHWDDFVAYCVQHGYEGVEGLSGVPGTVGASVVQNIGAYGQEVATSVLSVEAWDRETASCVELAPQQMRFGYRTSALKQSMYDAPAVPSDFYFPSPRYIVLSVTFGLHRAVSGVVGYAQLASALGVEVGAHMNIDQIRTMVLRIRAEKQMLEDPARYANPWMAGTASSAPRQDEIDGEGSLPLTTISGIRDRWSCGSFFTNPILDVSAAAALPDDAPRFPAALPDGGEGVKTPAAWLIDHAGFHRGYPLDDAPDATASLSTVHTLALTNRGQASAQDIARLAKTVQQGVFQAFGVKLVPEPVTIGIDLGWESRPADEYVDE